MWVLRKNFNIFFRKKKKLNKQSCQVAPKYGACPHKKNVYFFFHAFKLFFCSLSFEFLRTQNVLSPQNVSIHVTFSMQFICSPCLKAPATLTFTKSYNLFFMFHVFHGFYVDLLHTKLEKCILLLGTRSKKKNGIKKNLIKSVNLYLLIKK
jgi:hypothetical protein